MGTVDGAARELYSVGPVGADFAPADAGGISRSQATCCALGARASMPNFQTFSRSMLPLRAEPQITILRRGTISLNKSAHMALGSPAAVELLYDVDEQIIGLRPVDPRAKDAYVIREPTSGGKGPFVITAMAFTKFYGIDTSQSLRRIGFLDDGILCTNLRDAATPVTSNRARNGHDLAAQSETQQAQPLNLDDDIQTMER